MSRESKASSAVCAVVRVGMPLYTGLRNLSPLSHQPDARAPICAHRNHEARDLGIENKAAGKLKERTHRLDNPEPTPLDTPTSKETPAANASNGPATNGPATNGGTATATATRREGPPPAPSRKFYTITELNEKKQKELAEIAKEFNSASRT